jgi:hypothetical protein
MVWASLGARTTRRGKYLKEIGRKALTFFRFLYLFKISAFGHFVVDKGDCINGSIASRIGEIDLLGPLGSIKNYPLWHDHKIALCKKGRNSDKRKRMITDGEKSGGK